MAEGEKKSIFSKYAIPLIFIFALIIVGIYAWVWIGSEAGQRQLGGVGEFLKKVIALPGEQLAATKRAVSWTSETNPEAEKQGILLEGFSALAKKIQGGGDMILKYDLRVNLPPEYTVPTEFYCKIQGTDTNGEIIPPNPTTITSTKKPTVRCKFSGEQTEKLLGATKVEGGFLFPYTTKDVKLPVYFARESSDDFFDRYGIAERNPIRSQYNQEPVELAMGVSDENLQPVVVGENEFPMIGIAAHNRWGGKIKSITSMELRLPEEAAIKGEPTTLCPFKLEKTERGYSTFKAQASLLDEILIEDTIVFECWLEIDQSIISADADYSKKEYRAEMSYIYEVNPKVEVVTVE